MSNASAARQSALDGVLDARQATAALAGDLFEIADAVAGQPALRRALTDPGTPDDARADLPFFKLEVSLPTELGDLATPMLKRRLPPRQPDR